MPFAEYLALFRPLFLRIFFPFMRCRVLFDHCLPLRFGEGIIYVGIDMALACLINKISLSAARIIDAFVMAVFFL